MQAIQEKIKQSLDAILGKDTWTFINTTNNVPYDQKSMMGAYHLKKGTEEIASFELYPMINCCGICVSTKAEVRWTWRHKGLGTLLNSLRIDIARNLGYGVLMCTDVESNTYQRKVLAKNGWTDVHKFVNPRTRNTVFISVINL